MSGGYWVFGWGGLIGSRAAESKAYLHVVNLPGQNEELDGGTLCGLQRFKEGSPGGAWRDSAARSERDAGMGDGKPGVVCPRCADELLRRHLALLAAPAVSGVAASTERERA